MHGYSCGETILLDGIEWKRRPCAARVVESKNVDIVGNPITSLQGTRKNVFIHLRYLLKPFYGVSVPICPSICRKNKNPFQKELA